MGLELLIRLEREKDVIKTTWVIALLSQSLTRSHWIIYSWLDRTRYCKWRLTDCLSVSHKRTANVSNVCFLWAVNTELDVNVWFTLTTTTDYLTWLSPWGTDKWYIYTSGLHTDCLHCEQDSQIKLLLWIVYWHNSCYWNISYNFTTRLYIHVKLLWLQHTHNTVNKLICILYWIDNMDVI